MTDQTHIQTLEEILSLGNQIDNCIGHIQRGANVNSTEIWDASVRIDMIIGKAKAALERSRAITAPQAPATPVDLASTEGKVALQCLASTEEDAANWQAARQAGLELSVSPALEAAYVIEHGNKGKRYLDQLQGR